MDLIDRLYDVIKVIPEMANIQLFANTPREFESMSILEAPGSHVLESYMDGTEEKQMNYEITFKSSTAGNAKRVLWAISQELNDLHELSSTDGSFIFEDLTIDSEPFMSDQDEQFIYYSLDFYVKALTKKKLKGRY